MKQANNTVSSDTLSVSLNAILQQELKLSGELLELIQQEKRQLEQPLDPALDDIVQQKIMLLQSLQQATDQRQALMLRHGYDNSPQGVEFCVLACAHAPGIRQGFEQLAELARECHRENQVLGQLINRKSVFFSRLLAKLSNDDQPQLYQANGMRDTASMVNLRNSLSV